MKHLHFTITAVCLVLLSVHAVHAQTSANLFQSPGDADHADALVSNVAGLGFGTPFQLTLDSQFDFTDSGVHTQSDLNTSIQVLKTLAVGVGYTFNRDTQSLPFRMGISLSDGESWSVGLRTYTQGAQRLTELATMLRPAHWLSFGLSLSELVRGSWFDRQSWATPQLTSGITIRPLGKNHRLGLYQTLDQDFESSVVGVQWFSRIQNRLEIGVSTEHRTALSQRLAFVSLRTLGHLSLGSAAGWRSSPETDHSRVNLTARIRARARPSKRAGTRATIATIEISADSEYGISGWLTPVAHAPFLANLQTLDALARRDDLDGVLIKLGGFGGGWAQCEELKNSIIKLKKAQKRVYVFLPFADMRLYSVAAFADEIITTPTGGYDLTGASMSALHIKGLLDRVGVEAEFVTTGADKTAPETFTRQSPSPASIASQNNIVDTIFNLARDDIAIGRAVSVEKVNEWIAHGIHSGQMLKKHKLVDHQLHLDQAERYLARTFSGKTRIVAAHSFLNRRSGTWGSPKQIAVLFIVGSIIDGQTPTNVFSQGEATGSTTFRTALRRIVSDPQIAGIVIRIDSPGGTISASDTMWRVIRRARRKKPIVISFSNVAASGGYYAAVGAHPIYASERTLTGSIGVFAGKFNFSTLLRKWGVLMASFNRGPHAGIFSMNEPWSAEQRHTMQESIDEYDRIFQSRVKDGRPLEPTTIKTLAGGRVYMGSQALEHKLVDKIGGISEAILDLKAKLNMPQDLSNLVIAPSSDDSSRGFSLPKLGGLGSVSVWSSLRPYLRAIDPQFERLVSLVYTLRQGNAFALMPTIWHHN